MRPDIEYGFARVRDMQVRLGPVQRNGVPTVTDVQLAGDWHRPTRRFWSSWFRRFHAGENIFRLFDHDEVFARIAERAPDESFRYCIERRPDAPSRLLAISKPERPIVTYEELEDLAKRYDACDVAYEDGDVTSEHVPRSGDHPIEIGTDEFRQRFVLDSPCDGFRKPRIHLAMLRTVCTNGMIGYAPAFRSEISVGKDVLYSIARAMDSFDNFDGYAALRQRFESAQRSWASIRETQELYRILARLECGRALRRNSILNDFARVTGNVHELYGLANLDALSAKRQMVLPAKCRVYDLMNFASEIGTHHASPQSNRQLQAYIGTLISDEYDLEGSSDKVTEFSDFFVERN